MNFIISTLFPIVGTVGLLALLFWGFYIVLTSKIEVPQDMKKTTTEQSEVKKNDITVHQIQKKNPVRKSHSNKYRQRTTKGIQH